MSLGGWLCNTESIQQSVWDGMIGRRAAAAIREVQALRDLSVLSHHTHSKGFSAAVTPPGWAWGAGLIERKARKLKALSPSAAQAAWNEQPIYIVLSPSGPCHRQSFLHSHLKSGNTTEQTVHGNWVMASPIKDRTKEPKHHQTHSESPRLRAANNYYILFIMCLGLA